MSFVLCECLHLCRVLFRFTHVCDGECVRSNYGRGAFLVLSRGGVCVHAVFACCCPCFLAFFVPSSFYALLLWLSFSALALILPKVLLCLFALALALGGLLEQVMCNDCCFLHFWAVFSNASS